MDLLGPIGVCARDREPRARASTGRQRTGRDADIGEAHLLLQFANEVGLALQHHIHAFGDIHGVEILSSRARSATVAMKLALASCRKMPAHEVDDRPLHAALRARGATCEQPCWDDHAVDWSGFDAVLIRTTWDYATRLTAFRDWTVRVAAQTRLFHAPAVVRWNTHKHYLRELQRAGLQTVPTCWLDRGDRVDRVDLGGAIAALGSPPECVLKPCVGATARETLRFRTDAAGMGQASDHLERLLPAEDLMLQPFLASVIERGEASAIFVAGRLTHCVRKVPAVGDYRVQDDFGGSDRPYRPSAAERAAADLAMQTAERLLGAPLLFGRVDWLWRNDGVALLTELELVEPSLFFRHSAAAASALADALLARL